MELTSLIIAVISVIVATLSVIFSFITYKKTTERDRKQATLEAYNRLQAEVFDSLNTYTPSEIRDICEDTRSAEYKLLSGYLARIEHFCVGLNENIYDRNVFYAMAHGYFDGHQLRKRIEPLLDSKNQSSNSNELFYVNIYSVLMWLDAMKKK